MKYKLKFHIDSNKCFVVNAKNEEVRDSILEKLTRHNSRFIYLENEFERGYKLLNIKHIRWVDINVSN